MLVIFLDQGVLNQLVSQVIFFQYWCGQNTLYFIHFVDFLQFCVWDWSKDKFFEFESPYRRTSTIKTNGDHKELRFSNCFEFSNVTKKSRMVYKLDLLIDLK